MVNTMDQRNAIVYCVWYLVCRHCRYKNQSNAIVYTMLFVDTVDTKIKECNTLNAMFVETVDTTSKLLYYYSKHIHTFLPITFLIFNQFSIRKKFWKAETECFSNIPSILYMSILSIQDKDL